jgi:hypothetical protein
MRFRWVSTDSKHHRALCPQLSKLIAESARFLGAPWRIVFRIEIQDDILASKIAKGNFFASLIRGGKFRGGITLLECEGDGF